jgi:hypothetical protein
MEILIIPNEDGFGPSALLSYIVKQLAVIKKEWKLYIWNKSRVIYNRRLYADEINKKRILVEPISTILELKKKDGKISLSDTLRCIRNYVNFSKHYDSKLNIQDFDLVVDFGVPLAAKWAVKHKIKTLSLFDHCWSKTLEMILIDSISKNSHELSDSEIEEWRQHLDAIREDEKYIQSITLFPRFITPPVFFDYWQELIETPVERLKGVLGGGEVDDRDKISKKIGLPRPGTTVLIQGGDTPVWDEILKKIIPKLVKEDEEYLENKNINLIIYLPERLFTLPGIKILRKRVFNRITELPIILNKTIQYILPAVDLVITRAGGGTVNDSVAQRTPFVCITEPFQSQVQEILNESILAGFTRVIDAKDFVKKPLDVILEQINLIRENNEAVHKMSLIPNKQESVMLDKILKLTEE